MLSKPVIGFDCDFASSIADSGSLATILKRVPFSA
jgi:hypothetical protein